VPELPDVDILADAFTAALTGRPLQGFDIVQPLVLRGTAAELTAMVGERLIGVRRRGKFLTFDFGADRIVMNPMLTGRLGLAVPKSKAFSQTALVLTFGPRDGAGASARGGGGDPASVAEAAEWTRGAAWLPREDAPIELRYRDPTRMGKVYVLPNGVKRPVAGWEEQGPDTDDPTLDLATWRKRIAKKSGELKSLLKDQAFVAGIGNGYSDEVLWAAQLLPFRKRSQLADDEVNRLYTATREVPAWAISELRERVPPRFEVEQRDFLKVHRKGGQACPRCGTTLSEISPGGFVTTFCRGCQR
jgi:formamidopyrimidine-DNA glycosylase